MCLRDLPTSTCISFEFGLPNAGPEMVNPIPDWLELIAAMPLKTFPGTRPLFRVSSTCMSLNSDVSIS